MQIIYQCIHCGADNTKNLDDEFIEEDEELEVECECAFCEKVTFFCLSLKYLREED